MEVSEFIQYALGFLVQGSPGVDLVAVALGALLLMGGKGKSFGLLVLAIGLVLVFGGHLVIHITVPGGPAS
ncbi:hypothetical protein ACEZCY_28475 [Streptacidiphilus sp. N1-12]|uniref:Uncharacterized protein n=2 Tax=Streptacidiphilus alkalitolerans TaxID=3342712 RepID=A0ABV6VGP7_9ACTN